MYLLKREKTMVKEIYVDGIGNISVQGPVVTLSLTRENLGSISNESNTNEVLHLTLTGQNLIKITNILNNTLKRLAQRSQGSSSGKNENSDSSKIQSNQKQKKDKTVN